MPTEAPNIDAPLRSLRGVGPKRAAALAGAGLESIDDLLNRLPFRYEDRRSFATIADLRPGGPEASVLVETVAARLVRTRRRGFSIAEIRFRDRSGELTALWYNQPFVARAFPAGKRAVLFGRPIARANRREPFVFENPEHERVDGDEDGLHTGRIVPVYRRVAGIGTRPLRVLVRRALDALATATLPDPLPPEFRRRWTLPGRLDALEAVHFPVEGDVERLARGDTPAHRRLALEEMYLLQLVLASRRRGREAARGRSADKEAPDRLPEIARGLLPFRPTADQDRVIAEIGADLARPYPMGRLLQGDVGSGKTAVALVAMVRAAERGRQAVLLAPTAILAEQHGRNVGRILAGAGREHRVEVLTGSIRGAERARRLDAIASGEASLVIGTHALLERGVAFDDLALAIVDEQHRFGVAQRAALLAKGAVPDVLVMTATPIPRTLALTVFGDLDVSVLHERPPGRSPVTTVVRSEAARAKVHDGVRRQVARGHQAIVVVPRVEDGEGGLAGAREHARSLAAGDFHDLRVDVVHGRLAPAAKDVVMRRFEAGEIDVLVATTVVEVGIDVPNATVLVVEHAERFGLAQLHQLRGRVGRGRVPGYCVLMTTLDPTGAGATGRLAVLESVDDGFEIAERDLEFRGPGEVFATAQHGDSDLRFLGVAVREPELLSAARDRAAVTAADPEALRASLAHVRRSWRKRIDLAAIG